MSRIAIIGSGPAGRIAARAVEHAGHGVPNIYSTDDVYRRPLGAQYLHTEIPDITADADAMTITYVKIGSEEAYQEGVYGNLDPMPTTSWSSYEGEYTGWDLEMAIQRLRRRYPRVVQMDLSYRDLEEALDEHDLVIFTGSRARMFPADTCRSTQVYVTSTHGLTFATNEIVYNGDPNSMVTRISRLNGNLYWEHRWNFDPETDPFSGRMVGQVTKVIDCVSTDPLLDRPNLLLAGRQGKWDKSVLLHHVFDEVVARCELL